MIGSISKKNQVTKSRRFAGFGLLESGAVTKKNEVNIMMKNAADVVLGGIGYWMYGYGLQYGDGPGTNPFCGVGKFLLDADPDTMGTGKFNT